MKLVKTAVEQAALLVLCLVAALLTGCAGLQIWHNGLENPDALRKDQIDAFRVGDKITITFPDRPNESPLTMDETIANDGMITLLFNERIKAAGKTKSQLQDEIIPMFVPKYYKRLTVLIKAEERSFTIGGEVRNPGRQVYSSGMTVLQAIAAAGGFTEFSDKRSVEIIRFANQKKWRIDAIKAQDNPAKFDAPIYPGDQVFVPRRLY